MKIAQADSNKNNPDSNLELIIAKSALHLGRLTFKETPGASEDYLKKFYQKVKGADNKEFIDIGRVNLGMLNGTNKFEDYKKDIKNMDYKQFLATKPEYKKNP